jgi:hypothetical protein
VDRVAREVALEQIKHERKQLEAKAMAGKVVWNDLGRYRDGSLRGWETRVGPMRITLHGHIDEPSGVFVSCHEAGLDRYRIGHAPMRVEHKSSALRAIRKKLQMLFELTSGWD